MNAELSYTEHSARLNFFENHVKYLSSELSKATTEIKELKNELNRVTELLKLAGKKLYGSSAEKVCMDYRQLSLFSENTDKEEQTETVKNEIASYFRAPKRTYKEIYENLPIDTIVYDVPDDERICDKCGAEMTMIGYETYREIEHIPAVLKIVEHRRGKYVCRQCDKKGTESNFRLADAPSPLINHSIVSPSMLAYIINEKFCKAVPLYRLEQEFRRMGVNISRQTMSNWIISAADMLKPLYDLMHSQLVSENILHADETPLQVNHISGKSRPVKGYIWVYRTGKHSDKQIILYEYRNGRNSDYPREFLKDFSGYLHCDGLKQYDYVLNTVRVGCWAHLRRYFFNAVNVQYNKKDYSTIAGQGFLKINEIFHTEGRNPEKLYAKSQYTSEEIAMIRKEKSRVLAEAFFEWCEEKQGITMSGSLTGKAIAYALSQKKSLLCFLENPRLELTNNAAERAVRPIVMGRKNWLFANTEKGAEAVAVIFSVIETAKAAGAKPYDYMNRFFNSLRFRDFDSFKDFLPWNPDVRQNFYGV